LSNLCRCSSACRLNTLLFIINKGEPMRPLEKRLTRKEAAKFLTTNGYPCSFETLASKASRGGGPAFIIFGRHALYSEQDLLAWAESRVQHRGGQPAPASHQQAA
jgi:hypothetical protein